VAGCFLCTSHIGGSQELGVAECTLAILAKVTLPPIHSQLSMRSSISIVTRLRVRRPVFDSRQRLGFLLSSTAFRPALGPTRPPIQWVPGVKWPGRGADRSLPFSASVNNGWSCISTPIIRLHGVVLSQTMDAPSWQGT